ncbi:hypothetical protein SAMN05443572_101440 [Myxococcus fulvus]|uniref:N-acetyltransferase domain-containing protein n=1 Tax=Myxococcus fulvus TaxID=33 RepID=A0A511T087_MYXFU|nr:hypothetical protein [Myxococcus fulvus]GEN07545.1 hypothetical protein MFU01_25820 [Myxococcus fulvus]SES87509.1 hypothetical protein SAMN05443572_101440 [Myxococcus fulvus]
MNVMRWLGLEEMLSGLDTPVGCTAEQLSRDDIPRLTALLSTWYPDIRVGTESRHLDPSFYEREVYLRGESPERPLYAIVCREQKSGDLIGLLTLERNVRGLQLSAALGVVEPSRRGVGIGSLGTSALEVVGRNIGAEVVLYYSTLKTPLGQRNAEDRGYTLVGLVPAFDVDAIAPGTVKRVYEALYAKVLVAQERVHVPAWEMLTPPTRALFTHLFGPHPAQTAVTPEVREQRHG